MLQNYGGLPLERLNHMLRLFVVSTPRYDKTPEQLQVGSDAVAGRGHNMGHTVGQVLVTSSKKTHV